MNEDFVKRVINRIHSDSKGIALDIGAHHGMYSKMLSMKYKTVYAFEPFPDNLAVLEDYVKNTNIVVVKKAISDKSGKIKLYPCPTNSGGNSINPDIAECRTWGHSPENHIEIDAITLDEFVGDMKISFIKMDIEGAEDFVWNGGVNTLKNNQLNIILELHQKVNCEKLFAFFKKMKYSVLDHNGDEVDHFENDRHYLLYNAWPINI